jgi:hypothetical protein
MSLHRRSNIDHSFWFPEQPTGKAPIPLLEDNKSKNRFRTGDPGAVMLPRALRTALVDDDAEEKAKEMDRRGQNRLNSSTRGPVYEERQHHR